MQQERFHKLTEAECKNLYDAGLLSAHAYILFLIKCHGKPGWKWSCSIQELVQRWHIEEEELRNAIAYLIEQRLISAHGDGDTLKLWHLYPTDYNTYLDSAYWQQVKDKVLERDAHSCQSCNSSHHLQIHHKSYRNRGNELYHLQDLVTLCSCCHKAVHKL